jgi:hypothetical protein
MLSALHAQARWTVGKIDACPACTGRWGIDEIAKLVESVSEYKTFREGLEQQHALEAQVGGHRVSSVRLTCTGCRHRGGHRRGGGGGFGRPQGALCAPPCRAQAQKGGIWGGETRGGEATVGVGHCPRHGPRLAGRRGRAGERVRACSSYGPQIGSRHLPQPGRRPWDQGSTTLQCALRFCCPRGLCTEVFRGSPGSSTPCTEVVTEMPAGALMFVNTTSVALEGGRPLPVTAGRTPSDGHVDQKPHLSHADQVVITLCLLLPCRGWLETVLRSCHQRRSAEDNEVSNYYA